MGLKKAFLVLENGTVFQGEAFGAEKSVIGEVIFNTSMVGYQEILSDPASAGQIILQTFPMIGNYGTNEEDFDNIAGKIRASGYIVREKCDEPSNFRCTGTLDGLLKSDDIPGICGIDTRKLTRIIAQRGTVKAMLTTDESAVSAESISETLQKIKDFSQEIRSLSVTDSVPGKYGAENAEYRVALIDFGCRKSLIETLCGLKCGVTVFPHTVKAEEIYGYDGAVIAGGAGSPEDYQDTFTEIKKLFDKKIPLFGVSLGHNIMAAAAGFGTVKLRQGHHGANQPVINLENGKTYITEQNHNFCAEFGATAGAKAGAEAKITHINANDKTCEGIKYTGNPAFSAQFYPSVFGSVNDTSYLFSEFIEMMNEYKKTNIAEK